MATRYRRHGPYATPVMLMTPSGVEVTQGIERKTYADAGIINAQIKTYGGTEQSVNGLYSVIDTAMLETWYRPDITSGCRIRRMDVPQDAAVVYEVIGAPEDIEMRHQTLRCRIQAVTGGA